MRILIFGLTFILGACGQISDLRDGVKKNDKQGADLHMDDRKTLAFTLPGDVDYDIDEAEITLPPRPSNRVSLKCDNSISSSDDIRVPRALIRIKLEEYGKVTASSEAWTYIYYRCQGDGYLTVRDIKSKNSYKLTAEVMSSLSVTHYEGAVKFKGSDQDVVLKMKKAKPSNKDIKIVWETEGDNPMCREIAIACPLLNNFVDIACKVNFYSENGDVDGREVRANNRCMLQNQARQIACKIGAVKYEVIACESAPNPPQTDSVDSSGPEEE